jgi:hypothetical protein
METIKLKFEGKYVDHNVKANKAVNLQFKMPYTELVNYIQSIQMLNENVTVGVKIGADKPITLGTYMVFNINVDRDGEGKLKLNSQLDFIEGNALNELATRSDEPLSILLKAEIDTEENDEENSDDEEEDE